MAGKKYTDVDLSKYNSGYQRSDEVKLADKLKAEAEAAVKNYGAFQYGKQADYDQAQSALLNRKGFSYDVTGDALYQQYKDNYVTQGKQAMLDTMGQAAAMTGGYGNSWAATAGNQAYQSYLQDLNDKVPELYQLALDRYNAEGDRLATNYNVLAADRANALSEHEAGYNKLVDDRDYYGSAADAAYTRDYTGWVNARDYDVSRYWNEYNAGYQAEQDAIANEMAAKQLNETIRANKVSEKLAQEQWEYTKNQPASIDYAITNYSDVPKNIRNTLDGFVSLALDETFVGPLSKKQLDTMTNKVNTYISGLVNSEQMSPAVGDTLMAEYQDIIENCR